MQLGREDQRFELQGLEQGATYPVSLVAFKGGLRSRNVSTTLSTGNVESCALNDHAVRTGIGEASKAVQGGASGCRTIDFSRHGEVEMELCVQKKSIPQWGG